MINSQNNNINESGTNLPWDSSDNLSANIFPSISYNNYSTNNNNYINSQNNVTHYNNNILTINNNIILDNPNPDN